MAKRAMPKPYLLADLTYKAIGKIALKRAEELKSGLSRLKFDELNVANGLKTLYAEFDNDCRKAFRKLYEERYAELWLYLKDKEAEDDTIDELVEMELAGLLETPNANTHYVWSSEIVRKRDRAIEAVLSSPSKLQKQLEIDKAVRIWLQMAGWYTDFVSQDAELQALKDAGVKEVQRHEMDDERVCMDCRNADGEIYPIDRIPLSHLRCRRWFTPV